MIQAEKQLDLRVRRTRQLLLQAFMELLEKRPFQSITVQDITSRAMVNRGTFYDHFVDKYALLEYSIGQWFRQALEAKLSDLAESKMVSPELLLLTCCEFLEGLNGHCAPTDQELLHLFESTTTTLVREYLMNWLESAPREEYPSPALAATVTSWAIYGGAVHWSKGDRKQPVSQFVNQVLPMIQGTLKGK